VYSLVLLGVQRSALYCVASEQLQETAFETETSQHSSSSAIAVFDEYILELSSYLQVLEQRLFSEGLHSLGQAPV
jgi:cobalamin biosynthesis Mg chelatase CobN